MLKNGKECVYRQRHALAVASGKVQVYLLFAVMWSKKEPEKYVAIVEKWSVEHPVKTRQSEFLKMFPDASIGVNGALVIAPCNVNTKFESENCAIDKCEDCKKEYWLAELERFGGNGK